jgi:hypothetical protein
MTSDGDMLCANIAALNKIKNFIVENIFIYDHLECQICKIWRSEVKRIAPFI